MVVVLGGRIGWVGLSVIGDGLSREVMEFRERWRESPRTLRAGMVSEVCVWDW